MAFKEIKLPSGAILKIAPSPFAESKALYQAVLEEAKGLNVSSSVEIKQLIKDVLCTGFSSKKIESCLWVCMQRCIYNGGRGDLKIDGDTFEPVEFREDYTKVCMEVLEENIRPFAKSLFAELRILTAMLENIPASRQPTIQC